MIEVIMPQVGQDIPTARIIEWCKRENDTVEKGDVIAVVESDKASFEVEADQTGVVLKTLYREGDEVEVFKPIAYIGQAGETVVDQSEQVAAGGNGKTQSVSRPPSPLIESETAVCVKREGKVFASPSARRIAREHGLDLASITGSGPRGRVIHRDVITACHNAMTQASRLIHTQTPVATPTLPAGADQTVEFSRMRKRIAERLTLSKQTIPHFYLNVDIDMTAAMAWRAFYKAKHSVKVTVTDLIVFGTAKALAENRTLNAHVDSEKMVIKGEVDIGVATSVDDGLLVPVLAKADQLNLQEITEQIKKLAADARRGIVNPSTPGTFTISSLGMFGIKGFMPIINPPEAAILGVGAIEKRVQPIEGGVGVREMMTLTLAVDHRAVDGVVAAKFLDQLKWNLENIDQLVRE